MVKSITATDIVTNADKTTLKTKIEQALSEILSDKHDAKIQIQFIKQS